MKKSLSLFALLFVFAGSLFAQEAPTVEEIAKAYVENIGGAEAWKKVKNMKMSGTAAMQGMEFPLTVVTAAGDKMRYDVNLQGQMITQATNGDIAWQVMPFIGINEPTAMSAEEAADLKDQNFLNEFIDYEERGFKLESVEGKDIEGTKTLGVRVTNDEGVNRTYYFDPEFMIPVAMSTVGKSGQTKGVELYTIMSDYGEVDGLMMPMYTENKANGQTIMKTTTKKVEFNVEVDDTIFDLPKKQ